MAKNVDLTNLLSPVQRCPTYDVFVGNVAEDVGKDDLISLFCRFGQIHSVDIYPPKQTQPGQTPNYFSFVRYFKNEDALAARKLNNHELHGRNLKVNPASRNKSSSAKDKGKTIEMNQSLENGIKATEVEAQPIKTENLVVSHQVSPVDFWGQSVERQDELAEISEQLQIVCPGGQAVTGQPQMNKIYATVFSLDGLWYRCKAVKHISDTKTEVFFLDYGNSEVKENSDIREILQNLAAIKPFASKYSLHGVESMHGEEDRKGFTEGCLKLMALINQGPLTAEVYEPKENGVNPILLRTSTSKNVSEEMLKSGHAKPLMRPSSRPKNPSRSVKPLMHEFNQESDVSWKNGSASNKGNWAKMKTSQNNNSTTVSSNVCGAPGGGGDSLNSHHLAAIQLLRQEANRTKVEAEQLRQQLKEVQESHEKEKVALLNDLGHAMNEVVSLKKLNDKMTVERNERSLSNRLPKLIQSVVKVKEYRAQFPCLESSEDLIEETFSVVLDKENINSQFSDTHQKVEAAVEIYSASQNAVRAAESVDELPDLISARDQSRTNLHDELGKFILHADNLPLAARKAKVEEYIVALEKRYKQFLSAEIGIRNDVRSVAEANSHYNDWKSHKLAEFQEVRTRTNTCHNTMSCVLRTMHQQMSLESSIDLKNTTAASGLDLLLDGFQEALEEEAGKTDLLAATDESDAFLVGTVLRVLVAELRLELVKIKEYHSLRCEYTSLMRNVEPWLHTKPDLAPMTSVRNEIKTLKSKLRHKVADLQDIVENEDVDSEELEKVKNDLNDIRHHLHQSFVREDNILADFTELDEHHFPEICLQNPNFGIDTVREHDFLVKQGRALDQYDLEPMLDTNNKTLYKTSFCGKDAVLKEYIVDERLGVKKTDFLRRAFSYNKIKNPHIMPVEAIFFTSAGRQAYVQLPLYQQNLASLVEKDPPSPAGAYKILQGILMGLQAIHAANLVVGAIQPNNVLIDGTGEPVIAELDFSKTPHQRVGTYVSRSGLKFQPPEALKQEISWASDMYNLGLVALWLHYPSHSFVPKANGVPDFSALEMEPNLEELLMNLLQAEPASRRTSNSAWHLNYFSNSPYTRPISPDSSQHCQEETLQLRPKADSPNPGRSPGGGILKNKETRSPTSSTVGLSMPVLSASLKDPLEEIEIENEPAGSSSPDVHNEPAESSSPDVHKEPAGSSSSDIHNEPAGSSSPDVHNEPAGSSYPDVHNEPAGSSNPDVHNEPAGSSNPDVHNEPAGSSNPDVHNEPAGSSNPDVHNDDGPPPLEEVVNDLGGSADFMVIPSPDIITPRNTPVEGESGSSSPLNNNTDGLVKDAMSKASQLMSRLQLDESVTEDIHITDAIEAPLADIENPESNGVALDESNDDS